MKPAIVIKPIPTMKTVYKERAISFGLICITLFSGFAFFVLTVYPNMQITRFHKAFKKTQSTGDFTLLTENPALFEPYTSIQPWLRYLFMGLLVKGYNSEDRSMSVALMPFAVAKLEETLPKTAPYLNSYLQLGKGYEILAFTKSKNFKDSSEIKKAEVYYKEALVLVPNQQTTIIAYSINLYNQGKIAEAIALLRNSIADDDQIPELHYYLGQYLVYQNEKNAPEALSEIEISYNAGAEIDAGLSQKTYQKMLFYFAKVKDVRNATMVLNRLMQIDPKQSQIYAGILDYIAVNKKIPELETNQ